MLNERQKRFADEWLTDHNGTRAAEAAGYSKKTAASMASSLLRNPKVNAYIEAKKVKQVKKLEITQERVMLEIARLAFSDVKNYTRADGSIIPVHELTDDQSAAIASLEITNTSSKAPVRKGKRGAPPRAKTIKGRIERIKLWDKTKAVEMLAKHFKIYADGSETINKLKITIKKPE